MLYVQLHKGGELVAKRGLIYEIMPSTISVLSQIESILCRNLRGDIIRVRREYHSLIGMPFNEFISVVIVDIIVTSTKSFIALHASVDGECPLSHEIYLLLF